MFRLKSLHLIGLLALSLVLILLTLLIPVNITDQVKLAQVEFGYPLAFLRQDFSGIDPPSFPWSVSVASPWEYGMAVQWLMLLLDTVFVFFVLVLLYFVAKVASMRRS